jgi:two-component system NtrC family sensor kinase
MTKIKLRCKMALCSALIFFILVPVVTSIALDHFQRQFSASIEDQLFSTVSLLAEELDRKILALHNMVISVAAGIGPELLADPQQARDFLDQRLGLIDLFDNGLLLFSADGKIVAETGQQPSRTGFDLSYRPYIQKTGQTLAPYISDPFASSKDHRHPVVVMAVPLVNTDGTLLGILAGSIDLTGDNSLGVLTAARVGQSGYFYLYTAERTMVMHPDRSRIMQQDVPVGANKLYDRALQGFEGSGETVNSRGLHTLAAFKRLRSVDWILAANYPVAEALAPVRAAERTTWMIVAGGGLAVAVIMALLMRQLIAPLISLIGQIKEISAGQNHRKRVQVNTRDEIAELAGSFNGLMNELENREAELAKSQELYQTLADWSSAWIFWKSAQGKMLYISPGGTKITGYTTAQLMLYSEHPEKMIHPDDREHWQQHQGGADRDKEPSQLDFRIITKSGEIRWISHSCQPVYADNGQYLGQRGCNTDITERKRIEEQLRRLSSRDSQTGLYNRGHFDSELERLGRLQDFPVGMLVADLDGLKPINDEMGHAAGDRLIRQAATLLLKAFRADDVVARIGGDEFAVLMPGSDEAAVAGAVRRIRGLEARHNRSGKGAKLSLSSGTFAATNSSTLRTALATADARMYRDKKRRKATSSRAQQLPGRNLTMIR